MSRAQGGGADVLGDVVVNLCRSASQAWARGDTDRAALLFEGALRVVGDDEYVELCLEGCSQVDQRERPDIDQGVLVENTGDGEVVVEFEDRP